LTLILQLSKIGEHVLSGFTPIGFGGYKGFVLAIGITLPEGNFYFGNAITLAFFLVAEQLLEPGADGTPLKAVLDITHHFMGFFP